MQSDVVHICTASDASHPLLFGHRQRPDRTAFGRGQQGNELGHEGMPDLRQLYAKHVFVQVLECFAERDRNTSECLITTLVCRRERRIENFDFQDYYETPEKAIDAVKIGDAWGALYFTENFTDALVARMALGRGSDEETLDSSEVRVWLDMSSKCRSTMILLQRCYDNRKKRGDLFVKLISL